MTAAPVAFLLRDYQERAVAALEQTAAQGRQRVLVVMPTGTGKTVVFSVFIGRRPGRALVLAHRDELLGQAADKIRQIIPSAEIGLVKAERDETAAPIVVASVQTLSRTNRLERLTSDFSTLVVDEAHHAAADSYVRIIRHCGGFREGGPLVVGFTATPDRADGIGLRDVFEEIAFQCGMEEMIQAGYLCDLRALQVRLEADFGSLHTRAGDFVERELEETLLAANAPEQALEAYERHAAGRKALLFTPTVALAHAMARTFAGAGISAEALDGGTPADQRRGILARLHSGETLVVANCAVLTEGFDEPSVDCVIVARPTKSRGLYVQMVGRGTRTYPGKADCLILDLVGATTRHDLMTAATLFGLDPDDLKRQTVGEAMAARQEHLEAERAYGQLVAHQVELFRRRKLNWISAGPRFVLPIERGFISLEPSGGEWRVLRKAQGSQLQIVAERLSLGYAQGLAEDLVRKLGAGKLADRSASWRDNPASEKQFAALRRGRGPIRPGMTAGEASDAITAMIAGGARR